MTLYDFAGRIFTGTAAIRDGQPRLNLIEAGSPSIDAFTNLPIADPVAETDVHARDLPTQNLSVPI